MSEVKEEATIPTEETGTVDDLISSLKVKREEVTPPPFLGEMNFLDDPPPDGELAQANDDPAEASEQAEEAITDDDQANMEYLNYTNEHRDTAMFLIMTLDRGIGFVSNAIAKDYEHNFRKFENRKDISQDYLDVTAALVKKYQAKLSLEMILLMTVTAIYAPTLTLAYTKRQSNATSKKEKKKQDD